MSVIFYGYSEGIYSSRKLEKATCGSIPFVYLSGGNSISYRSICYFIEKFQNEESCDKDAEAAPEVDVEKALSKLRELSDEEKELKVKAHKAGKISKALSTNSSEPADKKLNTTDPESRFMKNRGKITQSYNAQAVSSNQFIAAKDLVNEENDQKQLEAMLEQTERNIELDKELSSIENSTENSTKNENSASGNSTSEAERKPILLADAGYNSASNLSYAQASSFDSYIAMNERKNKTESAGDNNEEKENHYSNEDFSYNDENDSWLCPQGKELENYGERIQEDKHVTVYTGKLEACVQCVSRSICLTTKVDQKNGYRSVIDDGYNISRKEMKEKMALPESQEIYKQRAIDVEPVFGQIKYNRNFMRFSVRGLSKVKTQFTIVCIAHNLSKIIGYMQENPEKLAEIYRKIADLIFLLKIFLKSQVLQVKLALQP